MGTDLLVAFRSLRRSPVFALSAVTTIALGIGAISAVFSLVDAVLLRPLPFHDPGQLVRIWEANAVEGDTRALVSAANANDWRARSLSLDDLALFDVFTDPTVLGVGPTSIQAKQTAITTNLFALLGLQPAIGRGFGVVPSRWGPLDGTEIILSHGLWQRAFGGDPGAIGRPVPIEGASDSVVVGVMPPGFSFPDGTEFWTPMGAARTSTARRDSRLNGAVGRLARGVSVASARADLQSIASSLAVEYPASNAGWTVALLPLHESIVGDRQLALVTLFAAVSCLMLVGCANVSNLMLARGLGRRRELAVRAALGASRARVVRLLLAETAVIVGVGATAGLVLARLILPGLILLAGNSVPLLEDARISPATLLFSIAAALVASFVTGLLPALRQSRTGPHAALGADGERSTSASGDVRLQRLIVSGELAVCLVLLIGAMLFAQTFVRLRAVRLGFDPDHVISVETRIPIYRTVLPDRWQRLASDAREAVERLRTVPGFVAAAATSDLPLAGNLTTTEITVPGESRDKRALYHRVSPDYFRTMGMTLVQGRDFTNEDVSDLARVADPKTAWPRQGVVIVNERAARTFWPPEGALGQVLSTSFDPRSVSRREVVGIVRDARTESIRDGAPLEVYVPYLEDPSFAMTLLVRTTLPPDQASRLIRRELRTVSLDMSTANVRMLQDVVDGSTQGSRFNALVVSVFGVSALLLSGLGVFGVFAFGVATRLREVGIRMALGATDDDITRMFLRQAAGPIGAGVVLGTGGATALGSVVESLLFGVAPSDLVSYMVAASLLIAFAVIASYLPVRQMLRTDPVRALRG